MIEVKRALISASDYRKVIAKIPELCAREVEVLLCLNSPHLESSFLRDLVADNAPQLEFIERLPNPPQFVDINPELGLKVLRFKYTGSG